MIDLSLARCAQWADTCDGARTRAGAPPWCASTVAAMRKNSRAGHVWHPVRPGARRCRRRTESHGYWPGNQ